QARFVRPTAAALRQSLKAARQNPGAEMPWLGSGEAEALYRQAVATPEREDTLLAEIEGSMDRHDYCFATPGDGSTTAWLEQLGAYSPIIHLQQVVGAASQHLAFTPEYNTHGAVHGQQVIEALRRAYQRPVAPGMPPRVENIYLTLEIFSKTHDRPADIIDRMRRSVAYWRQFIPTDGIRLDEVPQPTISA
ncbi:hypothetical protein LJC64_05060, partial [Ruminococcaceae bacterium OttesenSCG-928-A11]|nr:hypothetical protein [Ruminococcaceae bacterium OttesenSCG-928-A11]